MRITITGGLDLASNSDVQPARDCPVKIDRIAVLGDDYPGIKPDLRVSVGDCVQRGQTLFAHRPDPRIRVTSPSPGTVIAINRGPKRSLVSIVVQIDRNAAEQFHVKPNARPESIKRSELIASLLDSGLWPALRERPFDKIPSPDTRPQWLFVTAMDSNPLAADPSNFLVEESENFSAGLQALHRLARKTFVCHAPGTPVSKWRIPDGVNLVEFAGRHPAGLPGTHMHHLVQVNTDACAWHIGYQDVAAVGRLLLRGELWTDRMISLASVENKSVRLCQVPIGANLSELIDDDASGGQRIVSGPIFSARAVTPETEYLGRHHLQVSVLPRASARHRRRPGGGLLPLEIFDQVWPLKIPPVPLLRSLLSGDIETAEQLGCLSLAEEDLALCAYVCPTKLDYPAALRRTLDTIAADL